MYTMKLEAGVIHHDFEGYGVEKKQLLSIRMI